MLNGLLELYLAHRHARQSWHPGEVSLGRDRRVFHRVPVRLPCRLQHPHFGAEAEAVAVNLSLGGLGAVAPVTWPEGSPIKLRLGEPALALEGVIVFRAEAAPPYRYGVKFHKTRLRDLIRLRRLLRASYQGPLAVF